MSHQDSVIGQIRESAIPLTGSVNDYRTLLDLIGNARFVLIGEASHGTHEFYKIRAEITRQLILQKGFKTVAVEADWPDAYHVNRFVRAAGGKETSIEALSEFKRFPTWMWRNSDVLDFVGWLRDYNDRFSTYNAKVGFYGLDLYSLYSSMEEVIRYLEKVDPNAAQRAKERYSCFDHFGQDPQAYGYASSFGFESCREKVVAQLTELYAHAAEYSRRENDDRNQAAQDELFFAEQNARIAKNAEEYYRAMYDNLTSGGRVNTWNLRDRHMFDTLNHLKAHFECYGSPAKIVVWAHNSHIGDARHTEMSEIEEYNIGQLVREAYPEDAVLIGFTTYNGTVTAASGWGETVERKHVRMALTGSIETLFHKTGLQNFILTMRDDRALSEALDEVYLERAIGVIYRPETERLSHYFHADIARQFDAVIHVDHTRAVEPLDKTSLWERGELETYPSAL